MTPAGASTYTYSSGSNVVSPLTTTSYSVTGTSALGCIATNTAVSSVTVNTTPTITVNSGVICTGQSFTMVPSGATTYTYSSGTNVVNPLVNTSYSVTGTSALGCIATNTAVSSITVNTTPTITVNSGVICTGQSFTMTPAGASTYTYSSGSNVVSPLVNTSYSVTGTSALGCIATNTAVSSVTVNTTPIITVNSGTICTGQSFTMMPSGATTYTYSSGSAVVTPTASTTYTILGESLGCLSASSVISNIIVNSLPTITVSSATICSGQSFTMIPIGAFTYTYSSGLPVVSPTITSTYTITGIDINGCSADTTIIVLVNPTPIVVLNSNSAGICIGSTLDLFASGASSYVWNTGALTSSISVSPSVTTTYSATGINGFGCISTSSITVLAYMNPTVNIGPDIQLNIEDSYQFNPSQFGAVSYSWASSDYLNSISIIDPITTPLNDITYILTVTSIDGCKASDTVNVKVISDLIIANYISPNGDNKNDTWTVSIPALIKNCSIDIVDSYNQKVYHKDENYNNEFDGTGKNGENLLDGVYYYFIKENGAVKYKGPITLIR
jgi:gliding motility-associated-like protein